MLTVQITIYSKYITNNYIFIY